MNLSRIIERHAQFQPHKIALSFAGEDISYAGLWRRIDAATSDLARRLGVRRGDHVAYLGFNDPEQLVLLFALARLGAVLIPLNYRLVLPELQSILQDAEAPVLVAGRDWLHAAQALGERISSLRIVPLLAASTDAQQGFASCEPEHGLASADPQEGFVAGASKADEISPPAIAGCDEDPVLIVYTSGTTGRPKGAVHTQQGLIWNAVSATDYQEIGRQDHILSVLPMFHVGGLCIQTIPALHAGARVTIHARFDAGAWLRDVGHSRPTLSLLVPATMKAVLAHPDWPHADLSSLRMLNCGSSTVPESLIQVFLDRGVVVTQVYGATETGPVSIYLKAEDARRKVGYAGKVGLHVEVRLVGPDGADVTPGEIGEIWVRAPNVMQGYWRDPDNPSFQGGWFKSGDLARVDEEGFFKVVGRSKDVIISGGENIYPAELEHILAECPEIVEAAVFGEDDERWGEVVIAAILRKAEAALDEAAVLKLFEGRIARYKLPRRVVFVDSLPKNALGKVQKSELRQALAARGGGL